MSYGDGPVPPGARGGVAGLPGAPGPGLPARPAPHGRRLVALLVDGVVIVALAVAIFLIAGAAVAGGTDRTVVLAILLGFFGYIVAALLYAPVAMALLGGRTLGKYVVGLRVVGEDGVPVGFGRAFFREVLVKGVVLAIASGITGGLAFLADALWPFVDDRNRALHDLVSGTRVVED